MKKIINNHFEKLIRITGNEVFVNFIAIKLVLQAKGKPIPENDIWIATSTIQHRFAIYTNDAYFSNIDGLQLV